MFDGTLKRASTCHRSVRLRVLGLLHQQIGEAQKKTVHVLSRAFLSNFFVACAPRTPYPSSSGAGGTTLLLIDYYVISTKGSKYIIYP